MPEITGDLQLYTEFYKVGEAYGHWKFTVDDLEAYLDIPTVLWQDKLVAFGHTATGGLFYDTRFIFDYSTLSFTIGNSINTGQYSASIGESNLLTGDFSLIVGQNNANSGANAALFGQGHISSGVNAFSIGGTNIIDADYCTTIGYNLNTAGNLGSVMISDSIGGVSSTRPDSFTARFEGGYRFMSDSSTVAVSIKSSSGEVFINNVANNNTEDQLLVWNVSTKEVEYRDVSSLPGGGGGSGTVTSVDAAFLNGTALTVVGGAITTAGTFDFEWQGLNTDYVAGDGSIIAFPTLTSGTVTSVSAGNGMTFTTITTSGAVTLGTPSSITLASTNSVGVGTHSHSFVPGGTTAQYIRGDGTLATTPLGSVTSVGMTITVSTALQVTGSPITTSGTFAVTWTGNNTQYVAGDGSLITFPTLTSGTVTAVNSGAGMDFTNFTTSGTIILGTPSTITLASVNAATGTTHSHEFDLGGTAGQYLAGDNTLQTFPTIIDPTGKYVALSDSDAAYSSSTASATSTFRKNSELYGNGVTGAPSAGGYGHLKTFGASAGAYAWQIWKGVYDGDDLYFRSDGGGGYGSWIHIASTTYADNAANGRYVALNDTDAAYSGSFTDANSHTKNSELYGGGATNTPLSGYGFLKSHGASVGAFAWQEYKEVFDGDNRFFRGNASSTWTGSTWYQYASRQWVTAQGFTTNTGTLTNFSAGDLSPLFTTSEATTTTTPSLTFTAVSQPAHMVYAAPWGTSGVPLFRQLQTSDLQQNGATLNQVITWDGSAWTAQNPTSGITPAALTRTNDTNVTLTFGGTPSTALLQATSMTLGWSGVLSTARGGSKWTDSGTYLMPTGGNNIRTNNTVGTGWIHMLVGDATHTGRLEWNNHLSARVGFIGYYEDRFCYFADSTYHSFEQTPVRIQSVATDNLLTDFAVYGTGNELKKRTFASLGIIANGPVWYVQGGTTEATTNTQDIYHNGKLKLGTSTSSAYQLSVSGTGYFTSTVDFNNNVGIQGFTTGAVIKNIAKINGSNLLEIGVSGTDITLPAYTSARGTDTRAGNDKYLFVNASGVVKLDSDENIRNIIGWISKTTNTGVTAGGGPTKISGSTVQQTAGGPYTTVSGNLTIPAKDRYHLITVTVQFVTTSGVAATPNITFDVYNGSGVVQDSAYIVNHDVINDTKEYSFVLQGTTAGVTSIYVRATATVAGITVQKCHMKAMDMGPV